MVPPNEPIGDDDSQDTPDWLAEGDLDSDDAMAWLEEIAAKYDPDFEKSTDAAETTDVAAEPVTASAAEEDSLPDWLAEEELVTAPAAVSSAASDDDEEAEEGELPDWLRDDEPVAAPVIEPASASVDEAEDEEDTSLPDWLRDEAPAAAPVVVPAAADKDEEDKADDLPDWLKEEEPAPTPASGSVEDELAWLREPIETPEAIVSEDTGELPDWLKDEEPAAQVAAASMADDTDDALAWLNQHVADQGVSPDEIVSESLKVDTPPTMPVTAAPPSDAEAEAVSDEELPDWLKEAGGTEAMAEALASEPSDFDLEDIPELEADDNELAWLADTLDVETGKADDELAALFGDLGDEEEEEEKEVVAPAAEMEVEPSEEEEEAPAPAMVEEPEEEPAAEASEAEDLPDWLTEEEPKPSPGLTDWLRSPEPEEETEEEEEETPAPAMAEEPEEEPAAEVVAATPPPAPSIAPAVPAPVVEIPATLQGDFMGQLNTAREKMQAKASDEALALYENLVDHKQMLEQTISDMEYAAQSADKPDPRIRRVLGDALRASGRLQDALEAYRAALDEL